MMYGDPILRKYADLIQTSCPYFKRIYFGDPVRIGASELPALVIAKVDTRVSNLSNSEDRHEMRILFTVITDIRDTISDDKTMVQGVNELYNLIEGRQETTYLLKTDSLLYILRHSAELDTANNLRTDLDTSTRIDYGMTLGKRAENAWSIEGTLEITSLFNQVR